MPCSNISNCTCKPVFTTISCRSTSYLLGPGEKSGREKGKVRRVNVNCIQYDIIMIMHLKNLSGIIEFTTCTTSYLSLFFFNVCVFVFSLWSLSRGRMMVSSLSAHTRTQASTSGPLVAAPPVRDPPSTMVRERESFIACVCDPLPDTSAHSKVKVVSAHSRNPSPSH